LFLAFHYRTKAEYDQAWAIVNAFGKYEWYREHMEVSDATLLSETVEMSRDEVAAYLETHRAERLKCDGPTSKSLVEYARANQLLPRPSEII
jgi:hypothetical protein